MSDDKYSRCPDCGHKSVYGQMKRNGEDNMRCRTKGCGFYFFTVPPESVIDRAARERWEAVNQERTSDPLSAGWLKDYEVRFGKPFA